MRAVPPGSSAFLVVRLQAFGNRVVEHEAHVGFVNAHPERHGGANNGNLPVAPLLLVHFLLARVDAGVVGKREGLAAARGFLEPSLVLDHQRVEFLRNSLAVLLRKAIHDSAANPLLPPDVPLRDGGEHVVHHVFSFVHHVVHDVHPVEALKETDAPGQTELPHAVVLNALRGRGGEADNGHSGELIFQNPKRLVVLPEVVPPRRNAVHFVDDDPRQLAPAVKTLEGCHELPAPRDLLRGEVKKFQLAVVQLVVRFVLLRLPLRLRAPEHRRGDVHLVQVVQLVLDQGHERGNHYGEAVTDQGGELVTQTFTATGGHQNQAVVPGKRAVDRRELHAPEVARVERVFQLAPDLRAPRESLFVPPHVVVVHELAVHIRNARSRVTRRGAVGVHAFARIVVRKVVRKGTAKGTAVVESVAAAIIESVAAAVVESSAAAERLPVRGKRRPRVVRRKRRAACVVWRLERRLRIRLIRVLASLRRIRRCVALIRLLWHFMCRRRSRPAAAAGERHDVAPLPSLRLQHLAFLVAHHHVLVRELELYVY
mmetsp:Transcript_7901/g.26242  ORF Transcript_7901/g.26242 Transcript_7901/m.26242 type:complete len:541 (-) Transcript_7901:1054-2676(-)